MDKCDRDIEWFYGPYDDDDWTTPLQCYVCEGEGYVPRASHNEDEWIECPQCRGRGTL